jgi:MATE family multidrug resistance protein
MRKLLVIGLPISGGFLLEWGLFSSAALLVGWIGTTALAAHQIALQIAAILFMIPFGISLAATVRVGHAVGREDPVAARRAGFGAIALGAVFMTATTAIIVALRHDIPLLFIGDQTDAGGAASLAATLLLVGATFFVSDGVQGIAAGALRGFNDTRVPMVLAGVSFWLIGFPCAYGLAFAVGLGAVGIWIGFSIAVGTFAVMLVWRFHRLSKDGWRLLSAV